MISSLRGWLRRNRTTIAVGAGIMGAGYVAGQYILSKISDARERLTSERISKENLRRRFEQNQQDCTFTVLALLPTATANVLAEMRTEHITYEIQQAKTAKATRTGGGGGPAEAPSPAPPSIADTALTEDEGRSSAGESGVHASQASVLSLTSTTAESAAHQDAVPSKARRSKRQLWDDLIISSVTRAFTLLYILALLTMLTRVQLNLLGRRSYLSSVVALATGAQSATISLENNDEDSTDQVYGSDFDTNRKYLAFSWWLLNRGWADLAAKVDAAVRSVFGALNPRDLISFDRLSDLIMQVRRQVEGSTAEERRRADWLRYLLPPRDQEEDVIRESGILQQDHPSHAAQTSPSPEALRRLLDETADLIESPAFCHVLTLLLDAGFSNLMEKKLATEAFELAAAEEEEGLLVDVTADEARQTKVVLLPKVLSVLTRQAHVIGNGVPNEYLQAMETVRGLDAFAAVVYSSNWESEVRGHEGVLDSSGVHARSADTRGVFQAGGGGGGGVFATAESQPGAGCGEEGQSSIVMVDAQSNSFESAWEKAVVEAKEG